MSKTNVADESKGLIWIPDGWLIESDVGVTTWFTTWFVSVGAFP